MSQFNDYFDGKVFVINAAHRADRRERVATMLERNGIAFQWFDAHTGVMVDGHVNGNAGCVASHRALLEIIAFNRWPRAFIFEDDADIIYNDFAERFASFIWEIPDDWEMCYLAGHYGEPPISRVSKHVIRCGRMLTTSSYGITWQMARKIAPYLCGVGPIDSLLGGFHRDAKTYIIDPVVACQYPSFSDLQERPMDNSACMLDRTHVRALDS